MSRTYLVILLAILFGTAQAQKRTAGPIATPIDLICAQSEIFVATISKAASSDCRIQYSSVCNPTDEVIFELAVDELLVANEDELSDNHLRPLRRSEVAKVRAGYYRAQDRHKIYQTDRYSKTPEEYGTLLGVLKVDLPTEHVLSGQEINEQFVGRQFIFGIKRDEFTQGRYPFRAAVWPMSLRPWLEEYLPYVVRKHCLAPPFPPR